MEGITILKQTEVVEKIYPFEKALPFGIIIALILAGLGIYFYKKANTEINGCPKVTFILLVIAMVALGISACLSASSYEVPTGKYIYECYIEENVDIEDVLENYRYISSDGNTWTLSDK